MSESSYELVFAFRDQSPSFVHGFECGRIWWRMKTENAPFEETVVDDIAEDIIAMATKQGWRERINHVEGGWITVTLTPERKP